MDFPGLGQGPPEEQLKKLLAVSVGALVIDLILVALLLSVLIYYLMAMSAALKQVSPPNRDMEPGMVFLALIPCFNLIWLFLIVFRVASSLEREFQDRGLESDGRFGSTLGMWGCVLLCIGCSPAWMVFALLHARKIKAYVRLLEATPPKKPEQPTGYEVED